ncbi:MAG: FkbM family methyltransferase [Polyangia bacterium]
MSTLRSMGTRLIRAAASRARLVLAPEFHETVVDPRFPSKPLVVYRTTLGTYYLPEDAGGDCIAAAMRAGQVFEPEVVDVARRFIRPGTTVLDVGSNFGQMSLLFSKTVGPEGQVLAFEADDYVYSILRRNLDANGAGNVRPFFGVVYDETGRTKYYPVQDFKRFKAYGSYGIDPRATEGRSVLTLAIDDLAIYRPVSFVKVDVQGSDLFALRGAAKTIRRHRATVLFEYEERFQAEFKTCFQDYLDFMRDISYRIEKTVYGINYLAVPDERVTVSLAGAAVEGADKAQVPAMLGPAPAPRRCGFLQSRAEVDACTAFLQRNGFVSHVWSCKDWDIARILPEISDGNLLDMGSSESYILKNAALKCTAGEKYGIDLRAPDVAVHGARYLVGDLMSVPVRDGFFDYITCLSVIEHEVDVGRFAQEAARLLAVGGKLFVTFDYWEPKVVPTIRLYGLRWQPLDRAAVEDLISQCARVGLSLVEPVDYRLDEAVIRDGYFSPEAGVAYTFGLLTFEKPARPTSG